MALNGEQINRLLIAYDISLMEGHINCATNRFFQTTFAQWFHRLLPMPKAYGNWGGLRRNKDFPYQEPLQRFGILPKPGIIR
jgi:hypothetical protein